jgi:hypothetical protein
MKIIIKVSSYHKVTTLKFSVLFIFHYKIFIRIYSLYGGAIRSDNSN